MTTLTKPFHRRLLLALLGLASPAMLFGANPDVSPQEAAEMVKDGKAVLVDVREAGEWRQTGVAAPAVLLAKSDFDGKRDAWKPFLESVGSRKIILYCRSGRRAQIVADALKREGFEVENAGGFEAWQEAGLPVRAVDGKATKR